MDNNFEISNNQSKSNKQKAPFKHFFKSLVLILFAAVLFFAAGCLGYYLRDQSAKFQISDKQETIDNLTKTKTNLEKQLIEVNNSNSFAVSSCESTANNNISDSTIENIEASVTSKNTAALDGRMADTVCFAIAASDGIGDISKTSAIENLTNYLEKAGTWTFDTKASELAAFKAGDYANFFVDGAIIGKSSDNKVLLFSFNNAGKINVIFWSESADLLD